ncbi:MAG TPA: coniferyl-alcohol dehydrogenase [Ilumatobacteraceae bacterium]|nr:coniferyl-alcohol dehydrogenase [Ilumatobacteraceae bacterium]
MSTAPSLPAELSYQGKHVVITGAATGVGAAMLNVLHTLGAPRVTVLDVKAPTGPHDTYLAVDLGDEAAVDAAIGQIDGTVDVLFNNAAVNSTAGVRTTIAVNYLSLRRLSERLLGQIPSGGAIINTASIAGSQWPAHLAQINELLDIADWDAALDWVEGQTDLFGDVYSFSKEIVQVWTMRSSRPTATHGVRTNSVCPAPIDTPLLVDFRKTMSDALIDWNISQATGTVMTPAEVAWPLAFLGSPAASYINGLNMVADGGFGAAMTTGQVDFSAIS